MKKIIVATFAIIISATSIAQTTNTFPENGNVGIGTTSPKAIFQTTSNSVEELSTNRYDANLIIEGTASSRSMSKGATLGFTVPGNTDGGNPWQQGRIMVTPDNENNANASGRMLLQTRYLSNGAWRWRNNLTLKSSGNIGVGTHSPTAKLHINNGNNSYGTILANASETSFSLYTKTLTTSVVDIESFRLGLKYDTNENNGFISFYRGSSAHGGFLGFSTNGIERIRISKDGNVGIGTTDTKGYKLGVKGKIAAEEVKVALYNTWPDYVFENDYKLPSLQEVENHISEKGHLPNIPSAAEVAENGIQLGAMNAKLLEKIEELTLYMIEQNKKTETLVKEVETLKQKNAVLEQKIK